MGRKTRNYYKIFLKMNTLSIMFKNSEEWDSISHLSSGWHHIFIRSLTGQWR